MPAFVLGWFSPHPPIIIPAVGRGEEQAAAATVEAMQAAAAQLAASRPDAIIIFGPHGPVFSDAFTVEIEPHLTGDLARFGAPEVSLGVACDLELVQAIMSLCQQENLPIAGLTKSLKQRWHLAGDLDHGVMVPLWYLRQACEQDLPPVVILNISGLSWQEHYALGRVLQRAAEQQSKRVAVIASGDLSHRLSETAPAPYHPDAQLFDRAVCAMLQTQDVLALPRAAALAVDAGECGLRPLAVFLGCFDGIAGKYEVLSYQAPWGVGYMVALRHVESGEGATHWPDLIAQQQEAIQQVRESESAVVQLARAVVEGYIREGQVPASLPELPDTLPAAAGVFVTLYKHGQLRGCIGTTEATCSSLQAEIVQNAISAATADPRFAPVEREELEQLTYSVDVLGPAEPVADWHDLDPKIYGVIVEHGRRRGLLLPDLEGIDDAQEQVAIAKRKAGIEGEQAVQLYRFQVTRFH